VRSGGASRSRCRLPRRQRRAGLLSASPRLARRRNSTRVRNGIGGGPVGAQSAWAECTYGLYGGRCGNVRSRWCPRRPAMLNGRRSCGESCKSGDVVAQTATPGKGRQRSRSAARPSRPSPGRAGLPSGVRSAQTLLSGGLGECQRIPKIWTSRRCRRLPLSS